MPRCLHPSGELVSGYIHGVGSHRTGDARLQIRPCGEPLLHSVVYVSSEFSVIDFADDGRSGDSEAVDGVTDVNAGDFVKLAAGAWIRPMRSYLTYTGGGNPFAGARRSATADLPSRISVILVSANGETTEISDALRLNDKGQMTNDNFYDLQGRKIEKPTKGLYIHNGKITVIK